MSAETPDPELNELASALAALTPAAGAFNRDQLMYRAGQSAAGRRAWVWPGVAAGLLLVLVGLVTVRLFEPAPQRVVRVVDRVWQVPASAAEVAVSGPPGEEAMVSPFETSTAPRSTEYLTLQRLVERWGVDALPAPGVGGTRSDRAAEEPASLGVRSWDQFRGS